MKLRDLTLENIHVQEDDYIVTYLRKEFGAIKKDKVYNSKKQLEEALEEISKTVTKRFGIGVNINHNESSIGFMMPMMPDFDNIIDSDGRYGHADVENWLKDLEKERIFTDEELTKTFTDFDNEFDIVIARMGRNAKAFHKALDAKGVVIDLENALFTNLPKEIAIDTYFNIKYILEVEPGDSVDFIIAILLHELGHAFTGISYLYSRTHQNLALAEALQYAKGKTDNNVGAIILAGNKLGIKNIPVTDTATMFIRLHEENNKMTDTDKSYAISVKESEMAADRFATRFGMGKALVESLTVIARDQSSLTRFAIKATEMTDFGKGFGIITVSIAVSSMMVLSWLHGKIMDGFFNNVEELLDIYGTDKRRFNSIRNDMIRQIRVMNISKKAKLQIVKDLDYIEAILKTHRCSSLSKLGYSVSKYLYTTRASRELETQDLIARLQENGLHVTSVKFQELMDKRI